MVVLVVGIESMDLVVGSRAVALYPSITANCGRHGAFRPGAQPFPIWPRRPSPNYSLTTATASAKKRRDSFVDKSVLKQAAAEEEEEDDGVSEEYAEEEEDEILLDDNEEFEDEFEESDTDLYAGDGGAGGGISLAGTWWDKEALTLAEEVSVSVDEDLRIYAFKTSANSKISLRIEKLSSKYGSPIMSDIEAFSSAYRARLDEAEVAGTIPKDISLEVSSPGLERVIRVPEDLERFKDATMFVKYVDLGAASPQENEGVFKLLSFDLESRHCTWSLADVKVNRQKAGKGRPLNKKQREWRLQTPFESLRLVRRYSDC